MQAGRVARKRRSDPRDVLSLSHANVDVVAHRPNLGRCCPRNGHQKTSSHQAEGRHDGGTACTETLHEREMTPDCQMCVTCALARRSRPSLAFSVVVTLSPAHPFLSSGARGVALGEAGGRIVFAAMSPKAILPLAPP